MRRLLLCLLLTAATLATLTCARAGEADGLATAGEAYLTNNRVEKAKDAFFKALFHDENCPVALYELAKIFQKEGNTAAASDFFNRAIHQMENGVSAHPEFASKITDAKTRLQAVNPYAAQFSGAMEDYAQDLGKIVKKDNDALTNEEAYSRVQVLCLASIVPASKMPDIQKPGPRQPEKNSGHISTKVSSDAPTVTNVPLDVERALKSAGWTTITGQWKKKPDGSYEVTNGKLETQKINGAIQFTVVSGGAGTVSAMVRNDNREPFVHSSGSGNSGSTTSTGMGMSRYSFATGYGVVLSDRDCKVYTPQGGYVGNEYYPGLDHTTTLQPISKHLVLITVSEKEGGKGTALAIQVDGKKENNSNYKLNKDGPFTIEIKGTVVIEDPKAAGQ